MPRKPKTIIPAAEILHVFMARDVEVLERALRITTTALMRISTHDGAGPTPRQIADDAFRTLATLKNGGFG